MCSHTGRLLGRQASRILGGLCLIESRRAEGVAEDAHPQTEEQSGEGPSPGSGPVLCPQQVQIWAEESVSTPDTGLCAAELLSCVRLFATPWGVVRQAPLSLGFSRQEYWSGLPFPSPCMKVKSESEVAQSRLPLRDPMNCSPPSSSVYGTFQATVLEWGAIAFSKYQLLLAFKKNGGAGHAMQHAGS